MGRYSNLCDQGERIQDLLEMTPEGPRLPLPQTRQVHVRLLGPQLDLLVQTYRDGSTVYELATEFGVHRNTVSEILKRVGVPRRLQPLTPEQVRLAITQYESGLSLLKVGKELGCSPTTVWHALRQAGVEIRPRNGWQS
jgi:hypothetical protein